MWRAFFLAVGITLVILGAECLVLDRAVLASSERASERTAYPVPLVSVERPKEITPPEWAPWSLLSVGALTLLYSFTLVNRGGE